MTFRTTPAVLLLGFALVVPCMPQCTETPESLLPEVQSLHGFTGVSLKVEEVENAPPGVTTSSIQRQIEKQLSDARITVDDRVSPMLYVRFTSLKAQVSGQNLYPYGIEILLYQSVRLEQSTGPGMLAATWNTASIGMAASAPKVEAKLAKKVQEFIDAYRLANQAE